MRPIALSAVIVALVAGPVAAQDLYAVERAAELRAEQQMANQRAVALENQLSALEARIRTEEGLRTLREQAARPYLPGSDQPYGAHPPAVGDTGALATIPDDRLAASNARVREAAANRR